MECFAFSYGISFSGANYHRLTTCLRRTTPLVIVSWKWRSKRKSQFKMNLALATASALVFIAIGSLSASAQKSDISKRSFPLIFERGAATTVRWRIWSSQLLLILVASQILVALAIPADLENENVYVAINYAANYANPQAATHLTQPFNRFKPKTKRSVAVGGEENGDMGNNSSTAEDYPEESEQVADDPLTNLISRTRFYKFFINKLNGWVLFFFENLLN